MMSVCIALDIEGVLIPELWSVLADRTGEVAFRRTTTEEGDIAVLMESRIAAARTIGLTRSDIAMALRDVEPLPGAVDFLRETRALWPTILVSDTFNELFEIVSPKLLWPTVFCHSLRFDSAGRLTDYRLRQHQHKPKVVAALRSIGFRVMAAGDSLNDICMLRDADSGAFFNAPLSICAAHPALCAFNGYAALLQHFKATAEKLGPLT